MLHDRYKGATIDLKHPKALTIEAVRELIRSKNDSQHRQLRVSENGIAYLSDDVGFANIAGVKFRFCTFSAGCGYTGEEAANDDCWVLSVFLALKKAWVEDARGYIETIENAPRSLTG